MSISKIIMVSVLSFATIQSQIISFSKDSLQIYWNNDLFIASDTTWLFNSGESELLIDSILTKNQYGYRIYSSSFPVSDSYIVGFDKPPINLNISPGDSMEIILADPDCKEFSVNQYFTDTLIFVSNSIPGRYKVIDVRGDGPSNINDDSKIITEFKLFQNYPNPFNPNTKISFQINKSSEVKIIVYDILGNIIEKLIDGKLHSGKYEVDFNGTYLSSGIYFYRLISDKYIETKKLSLIK